MSRSTALMVGAIFGFVAGVLFGSMSRTAGLDPLYVRVTVGAVVSGFFGGVMGGVASQMTRDSRRSGLAPAVIAAALAGAFGAWQWNFFIDQLGLRGLFRL